jgi:aminoglycoside phosphotransferase (APT) family kinase protein
MPSITSEMLFTVARDLGLQIERFEPTRAVDADTDWPGNANWLAWTKAGECLVLRRYHALSAEEGLAYEFAVLRHLAGLGWPVPSPVTELVSFEGRFWAATLFIPGRSSRDGDGCSEDCGC